MRGPDAVVGGAVRVVAAALALIASVAPVALPARAAASSAAPAESIVSADSLSRLYRLILRSPSGVRTRAMLRVAPNRAGGRMAGVVVAGGFGSGWRAAEFLDPEPGFAVLSVDYPYEGRRSHISVSEILARGRDLWRATHEASGLLVTAGDYLAGRPDVDSTRIVLVGASLGVPFALHAAAESDRFRALALLYGCADLGRWVALNLRGMPRWMGGALGWLAGVLYGDYEPAHLIGRLSPRPVLLVNGRGDPRVPMDAARRLYEAAGNPREQIWIDGAHVGEGERALLGRLLRVTVRWLRESGLGPSVPARGGAPPPAPDGGTRIPSRAAAPA